MKTLIILFSSLSLLFLSGCCKHNEQQEQFYIILNDYINTNGETCLMYVNNDKSLIERDREKYRSRHRTLKKLLGEMQ